MLAVAVVAQEIALVAVLGVLEAVALEVLMAVAAQMEP
jgi:hypothetical protein